MTLTKLNHAPARLIEIWERATGRNAVSAALAALAVWSHDATPEALAALPIGRRDALLLEARRALIGDSIEVTATCPACSAEVEAAVSCSVLSGQATDPPPQWQVAVGRYRVQVRPLHSSDELVAAGAPDPATARETLVGRAVVAARRSGRPVRPGSLPAEVVSAIAISLLERDPLAEVALDLVCPACAEAWTETFDTPRLVVEELATRGREILRDVDLLARTYGWTETEILRLPDARRATYVALAAG